MPVVTDDKIADVLANIIQNQDKVSFVEINDKTQFWNCPETEIVFHVTMRGKEIVKE